MAVEDVEDAEGQAVLQRPGAVVPGLEFKPVAKVEVDVEGHLPVVGVREVVEDHLAGGQVTDVLAGRDGLPVAGLQGEACAHALPLPVGVEDVPPVVAGREGTSFIDIREGAVRLRPGVGQAPLGARLGQTAFVEELRAVGRAASHLHVVVPSLCRRGEHRHGVGVIHEVFHLLVVAADRHGLVEEGGVDAAVPLLGMFRQQPVRAGDDQVERPAQRRAFEGMVELCAVVVGRLDAEAADDAPFGPCAELPGHAFIEVLLALRPVLVVVAAHVGHEVHRPEIELHLQEGAGEGRVALALGEGGVFNDLDPRLGSFGSGGAHVAALVLQTFGKEEVAVEEGMQGCQAIGLLADLRLELQIALVTPYDGRMFHPVPEVVIGDVGADGRCRQGEAIGEMADGVFPAQRIVRGGEADRIAVAATEARKCQLVSRGDLPLRLHIGIPYAQRERGHPAVFVEAFFQQAVFQPEGRPACGCHHRGLVPDDGRADRSAEEGVRHGSRSVQGVVVEGGRVQCYMAGGQAALLASETADAEVHRGDGVARHRGRQAEQVAQAVDPHAVERKEVIAQVAAACKKRREAFGSGRHAGPRHGELDGVVLADGAQDHSLQGLEVRGEGARQLFVQPADGGFHRRRQGVLSV